MNTPTQEEEVARLLQEARLLIVKALIPLDKSSITCDCCGARRRVNFLNFSVWDRLKTIPQRLLESAEELTKENKDV